MKTGGIVVEVEYISLLLDERLNFIINTYKMISFEKIPDELKTNGELLSESTSQYEFLDNMTKTILAENSPIEWSEVYKERIARTSEAFKKHLDWLKEARHDMLKQRTYQEALNARFEWFRTQNANKRSEMKLI